MRLIILSVVALHAAQGFRVGNFFKLDTAATPETKSLLGADDYLMMPKMMSTMGRVTKGLPVEYRAVPLIVGTKEDMDILKEELKFPLQLPKNVNSKTPKKQVVAVPLTLRQMSHTPPVYQSKPTGNTTRPKNGNCPVSLEETLPLLRVHPIPTLVHDNPDLVLNMIKLLVGPKPDGSAAKLDVLTSVPEHITRLTELATRNPMLVQTLAKFDPSFIPHLVKTILGIDQSGDDADADAADADGDTTEGSPF